MTEDNQMAKTPSPMDYQGLLDYGLAYIKEIGSRHWTDFHAHDPGVTILEALTLAVNDLSYRSSARMADLLTRKGGRHVSLEGAMYPADVILSHAPTTQEDYRKLVLENIPGIRNVWFEPATRPVDVPHIPNRLQAGTAQVNGCYRVRVELEDLNFPLDMEWTDDGRSLRMNDDNYRDLYRKAIGKLFIRNRNLCEEILDISFLEPVNVGLCAELEVAPDVDMQALLQGIYDRMCVYINPTIPFHTVEDLLSKGREPQDIFSFDAPALGFIDRQELASFNRKEELYVSDVISILMGIPGIRSVRHIHFEIDDERDNPMAGQVAVEDEGRILRIKEGADVTFSFVPYFLRSGGTRVSYLVNSIVFNINGLTFLPPNPSGGSGARVKKRKDERVPLRGFRKDMPVPEGAYRSTDRYFSFQNLLPETYRMGIDTLPNSASVTRKAERMQLKAYLTFFDQLLADYLAQLDRFQDLLSVNPDDPDSNETYFHGKLTDDDITDVSKVLEGFPDYEVPEEVFLDNLTRKNKVLDHLLSRFAESFAEYATLEFIRNHSADENMIRETVEDKKRFLADYPRISSLRSCGLDWTGVRSVTGVERRIMRRLGIDNPDARGRLSQNDELGLYVIEHNLLAPRNAADGFLELARGEGEGALLADPYSFRVTALLSAWTDLGRNLDYRQYAERIIREEIPAHIFVKVCWISKDAMAVFEDAYTAWRSVMTEGVGLYVDDGWELRRSAANATLVDAFKLFANIYPDASLAEDDALDYDHDSDAIKLDATYLGSGFASESDPDPNPTVEE